MKQSKAGWGIWKNGMGINAGNLIMHSLLDPRPLVDKIDKWWRSECKKMLYLKKT